MQRAKKAVGRRAPDTAEKQFIRHDLLRRLLEDIAEALEQGSSARQRRAARAAQSERGLGSVAQWEEEECDRLALGAVGGWAAMVLPPAQLQDTLNRCITVSVRLGGRGKGLRVETH